MLKTLIVDDDGLYQVATKASLKKLYDCKSAYNGDEAIAILKNHAIDILLLDIQMRSENEGLVYLSKFREIDPELIIIMTSSLTDFNSVREAMRLGANDYVSKGLKEEELIHAIDRQVQLRKLQQKNEQKDFEVRIEQKNHPMIGNHPSLKTLRTKIEKAKATLFNVIITGETGTGKEVIARQLRRTLADGTLEPFISVDSSTIQSTTAESQLFGHEKGAFTGADKTVKGIFEEANGGTVYFDEISNMPMNIQQKLLRVIQEKEVVRLGSSKSIPLEFRVICATNRNLDEMVAKGEFKDDLLQRLSVIPLEALPLRDRKEDIPLLLEHFTEKYQPKSSHSDGRKLVWQEDAIELLMNYSWPGNIRELGNLVAYLLAMTDSLEIASSDLPPKFRDKVLGKMPKSTEASQQAHAIQSAVSFYDQVGEFEKKLLKHELEATQGNISKMALKLGMDRSHLYTKLKEHSIQATRPNKKEI